jgi:nitrile hydratase
MTAEEAPGFIFGGMADSPLRPDRSPSFKSGDRIRTIPHGIAGHTRLPRYARGQPGYIEAKLGSFVLADANAAGAPRAEWLYRVAFDSRDLWGAEAAAGDSVVLDLWESYLEAPA